MYASELVVKVSEIVEKQFKENSADHDWFHIQRVFNLATYIQKNEGGNLEIIQISALLHDVSDHKLNGGVRNDNGRVAKLLLDSLDAPEFIVSQVVSLVDAVSFKGANVEDESGSLELDIVRDADRLDAIGAIGIARTFHYGGSKNRDFYIPSVAPKLHDSFEQYASDKSHTINHFYEKLFLLKDRLMTNTAKEIGEKRHSLMKLFVDEFLNEWNCKLNC